MPLKNVFCVLILSSLAMARSAVVGEFESSEVPSFIASIGAEGQKEFEKILGNKDLTIAETDAQLSALADEFKVSDEMEKFQLNSDAENAKLKKQQKELTEKLASVFEKLESIYANKDQTRIQQEAAIDGLLKSNQKLIPLMSSVSSLDGSQSRIKWPTVSCTLSF